MQVEAKWHRPGARLDYEFDWSEQLSNGDTITSRSVSIVTTSTMTADSGVIVDIGTAVSTGVVVWVNGGAVGDTARVLCTVTTAGGRTDTLALDLTVGYAF